MLERKVKTEIKLEETSRDGFKAGFISATYYHDGILFLNQIRVEGGFRRSGYGRILMERLLNLSIKLGARRLEGNFRPDKGSEFQARIFYRRMGIQISNETLHKPL